jgi:hypothetical protein
MGCPLSREAASLVGLWFTLLCDAGEPSPPELRGIIPLSFEQVFDTIAGSHGRQYLVRASFLEIYMEVSGWSWFHARRLFVSAPGHPT